MALLVVAGAVGAVWLVWGFISDRGDSASGSGAPTVVEEPAPTVTVEPATPQPTTSAPEQPPAISDSGLAVEEVVPADGSTVGGEAIVLKGRGFTEGLTVRFGTRDALDVQVLTPQTARVTLPPGAPGPVDVEVLAVEGTSARLAGALTYVDRPPRIVMAIRPARGTTAGGTEVTIVGTGFEPGARVVIGGERATDVEVLDATRIRAVTPAHEEGVVDVLVRNPDLPAAVLPAAYAYVPGPTISSAEPAEVPETGGVRITVLGTGFEPGVIVSVNGLTAADVRVLTPTRLTATAPIGVPGPAVLVVTNPDQPSAVLTNAITYMSAPTPASAPPLQPPVPGEELTPAG